MATQTPEHAHFASTNRSLYPYILATFVAVLLISNIGATKLIAFGPHVQKERLAESVAAGADAAVSRGELLGGFQGLVRRWLT